MNSSFIDVLQYNQKDRFNVATSTSLVYTQLYNTADKWFANVTIWTYLTAALSE